MNAIPVVAPGRRFCRLATLLVLAFALTFGLLTPGARAQDADKERPFELFGGYSYLHEDGNGFNGWTATFIANINKWFGIAADFDGHYRSATEEGEHVSEHEHGFTFGPHVSFHNESRLTPFAFALFGGAHASVSLAGRTVSDTGFAGNFGGGVDVHVNEAISVRLIQIDAAYTRFNGVGNTSPRISTGIVFHFGTPR